MLLVQFELMCKQGVLLWSHVVQHINYGILTNLTSLFTHQLQTAMH